MCHPQPCRLQYAKRQRRWLRGSVGSARAELAILDTSGLMKWKPLSASCRSRAKSGLSWNTAKASDSSKGKTPIRVGFACSLHDLLLRSFGSLDTALFFAEFGEIIPALSNQTLGSGLSDQSRVEAERFQPWFQVVALGAARFCLGPKLRWPFRVGSLSSYNKRLSLETVKQTCLLLLWPKRLTGARCRYCRGRREPSLIGYC